MTAPVHQRLEAALKGRYALERELGAGGMATVFLARDLRHHRRVAIKVMHSEVASAMGAERFLREIDILAALAHPHILPLHDSGGEGELLFYVMPFVEGGSLRELLAREGRVLAADALRMTCGVATALDFAHRRGIVHRDIKPENILLHEGVPVLADFGIAMTREEQEEARASLSGFAMGTPAYMSPEQALAEKRLDGRTDLYSVGCVLFEMLTGVPPYGGDDALAITAQKLVDPVPDVEALAEGVPPGLRAELERALAYDPDTRHASAAELAEALNQVLVGPRATGQVLPGTGLRGVSVAVLPFVNMSAEPENEFFSDGISEELTQALAAIDGLNVVARTSAFAFKGSSPDVREVGKRLGVTHVLEGSVRRSGDRVRITVELIATQDGYRVWSDAFDRTLDDVLAVQGEIARGIVEVLASRLASTAGTAPGRASASPEAYDCYLRGRYHWNRRTESELEKSIGFFHRAIELDPGFSRAYAGLADSYLILGVYGMRPPGSVMREAEHAARVALALEPGLAEAVTSRGCVRALFGWDWQAADADFRHAIALNPQYPTSRQWYAMNCLTPLGRFEDAERQLLEARRLDPLSLAVQVSLGFMWLAARRPERAEAVLREAMESDAGFGVAHFFLGQVYEHMGRLDDSCATLERAIELTERSAEAVAALARSHALAGRPGEAGGLLEELERRALGGEYVSPALFGQVRLGLGDVEEALRWMERAVEVRAADVAWFRVLPTFDALRHQPRFAALLERSALAVP